MPFETYSILKTSKANLLILDVIGEYVIRLLMIWLSLHHSRLAHLTGAGRLLLHHARSRLLLRVLLLLLRLLVHLGRELRTDSE